MQFLHQQFSILNGLVIVWVWIGYGLGMEWIWFGYRLHISIL